MLDLTDFAVQEQPEDNFMVAISRAWYNGSYTIVAKPIKSLQLHYTLIQFLIMADIPMAAKPIKTLELRYPMITFIILYYTNCNVPSYTLFSFIS